MFTVMTKIIRWLIFWIVDACVNTNVFSWSLYVWITNLDFSYACEMFECFISSTKRKLKMRTFLDTFEMMIISKTCRFNKSFIYFRLDSAKVEVKMKINDDESTSSCRNTVISAKFWYRSDRRLARMSLAEISDARFWFSSSDESIDWTFSDSTSLIDWTFSLIV